MKMPEIPKECGLGVSEDETFGLVFATNHAGVCFCVRSPSGRAAFAALCMATIDELLNQHNEEFWGESLEDNEAHMEVAAWYGEWYAQWAKYGGWR